MIVQHALVYDVQFWKNLPDFIDLLVKIRDGGIGRVLVGGDDEDWTLCALFLPEMLQIGGD